jgi:hypothetical protein
MWPSFFETAAPAVVQAVRGSRPRFGHSAKPKPTRDVGASPFNRCLKAAGVPDGIDARDFTGPFEDPAHRPIARGPLRGMALYGTETSICSSGQK